MRIISVTKSRQFLSRFIQKFWSDGTTDLAALLAFYFFLSLFPLLFFLLTLLPYFSIDPQPIITFIRQNAPGAAGNLITRQIHALLGQPKGGLLLIGLIVTLMTASNAISALIRSFNKAYGVKETRSLFRVKGLSVLLTVGMVFVILVTLILPVFGDIILKGIESFIPLPLTIKIVYHILRWLVGWGVMIFVLMMLYRFAPNETFQLKEVFWGAVFATIGWQLISFGLSFYISHFAFFMVTYGALASMVVMMLWFYLTGLVLIMGGQINATIHQLR